jgi:Fuc2NAc and GlcNAc transferase
LAGAAVLSGILTGAVKSYAERSNQMDVANERSAHQTPTPRGGGLAVVTTLLAFVVGLAFLGFVPWNQALALTLGGGLIAGVGWMDDKLNLPLRIRLVFQIAASALAVWAVGGVWEVDLGSLTVPLGWAGNLLAVFVLVWLINLFNFMDGINGISGTEALLVGGAGGLLLAAEGELGAGWAAWVLASASVGFLYWNWKGRIFMGDVGSTFNGFVFGVLALIGMKSGVGMMVWLLLMGTFFADATTTLVCRMINREKVGEAHSTHAFQFAFRRWGHHKTTIGYGLVNLLFLFPLAWVAYAFPSLALPVGLGALAVLAGGVLWLRGGVKAPGRPVKSA